MAKGKGRGGMPSNRGDMMAQLQRMQEQMQQAQLALAEETVEASAGGGAVRVVMTGHRNAGQSSLIRPLWKMVMRKCSRIWSW